MSHTEVCTCTDVSRTDLQTAYCATPIGKDTSGNFALSYKGVAVRTDCNRFVAFRSEKGAGEDHPGFRLYDVTGLTLPGCDALVYRIPVDVKNINLGNLVLISDCPLQVLYVTEKRGDALRGFTSTGQEVTYIAPIRLGECARYIRIYTVLDTFRIEGGGQLTEEQIALIGAVLCCGSGGRGLSGDFLSSNVAGRVLETFGAGQIPLLLALQQGQCLESFILTRALQGDIDQPLHPLPEPPEPPKASEADAAEASKASEQPPPKAPEASKGSEPSKK